MMKTAKVNFHLKCEKANKVTGEAPIYCRITVDGKRSNISINRSIHPQRWEETDNLRNARKKEDRELNFYMESIKSKIKEIERELLDQKIPITSENIKNLYSGNTQKSKSLIEVFEWHNKKFQELVLSEEAAAGTLDRYKQVLKHLKAFLKLQYKRTDILLDELEYSFITNFDHYLRTEKKNDRGAITKCGNNSTVKYIRNFRKIIKRAVDEGWLEYDLFARYKGKVREIEREFLTPEEIEIIQNKEIDIPRLSVIRDIFCFSIFTGYAYSDVKYCQNSSFHASLTSFKCFLTVNESSGILDMSFFNSAMVLSRSENFCPFAFRESSPNKPAAGVLRSTSNLFSRVLKIVTSTGICLAPSSSFGIILKCSKFSQKSTMRKLSFFLSGSHCK